MKIPFKMSSLSFAFIESGESCEAERDTSFRCCSFVMLICLSCLAFSLRLFIYSGRELAASSSVSS